MSEVAHPALPIADVLSEFGLGDPTAEVVEAARGEGGRIFRAETTAGTWALKKLFDPEEAGDVDLQASLMSAVAEEGVCVPIVVRSQAGTVLRVVGGGTWRVFEWIDIAGTPGAEDAGATLARLHRASWRSEEPTDPWFVRRTVGGSWEELASQARGQSWEPVLRRLVPDLIALDAVAEDAEMPPRVVCHRDFHMSNVVLDGRQRVVVLDWDNCGPLAPEREVGCALALLESGDAATQFLTGYRRAGGEFEPRGLNTFATAAAVWGNYLGLCAMRALAGDARAQGLAEGMLQSPVTVRGLRELMRAATRSARPVKEGGARPARGADRVARHREAELAAVPADDG